MLPPTPTHLSELPFTPEPTQLKGLILYSPPPPSSGRLPVISDQSPTPQGLLLWVTGLNSTLAFSLQGLSSLPGIQARAQGTGRP